MTDNEIIKALECCLDISPSTCKNCPLFNVTNSTMVCSKIATKFALDLINRQKSEIDSAKSKIEICAEVIERQDKEIERLKTNLNVELDNFASEYDDKIKAEAYKEFAERLKNEIISDTAYGCDTSQHTGYYDYQIKIGDIPEYIDNLLKEMVGEKNLSQVDK